MLLTLLLIYAEARGLGVFNVYFKQFLPFFFTLKLTSEELVQ